MFASGAGKEARNSVGTAVAGGMLLSTFLNIVFIPVLYVVVQSIRGPADGRRQGAPSPSPLNGPECVNRPEFLTLFELA